MARGVWCIEHKVGTGCLAAATNHEATTKNNNSGRNSVERHCCMRIRQTRKGIRTAASAFMTEQRRLLCSERLLLMWRCCCASINVQVYPHVLPLCLRGATSSSYAVGGTVAAVLLLLGCWLCGHFLEEVCRQVLGFFRSICWQEVQVS